MIGVNVLLLKVISTIYFEGMGTHDLNELAFRGFELSKLEVGMRLYCTIKSKIRNRFQNLSFQE